MIDGGAGNDRIWVGNGKNHVFGGAGNDRIFAPGLIVYVSCGAGVNVAYTDALSSSWPSAMVVRRCGRSGHTSRRPGGHTRPGEKARARQSTARAPTHREGARVVAVSNSAARNRARP
jgi:hypothetical protein